MSPEPLMTSLMADLAANRRLLAPSKGPTCGAQTLVPAVSKPS